MNKSTVKYPPTDAVPVRHHVFYWLTLAINRRNASLQAALAPYGCKVAQWRVMNVLRQAPGTSVGQVATATAVDRTTLTRTLDGLEAQGLLTRRPLPENRRVVSLSLTPAGQRFYDTILPVVRAQNAAALQGVSPADTDHLIATLGTIVANLGDVSDLLEIDLPAS